MFNDEFDELLNDFADTAMLDDNGTRDAEELARHIIDDHLYYTEDYATVALALMSDCDIADLLTPELEGVFIEMLVACIEAKREERDFEMQD